ncbi:uncharacterized protein CC84DRAFT_753988 [Paraphaeosphaeria sporulosa]|uniref:Uncharacterized protein n=1 Tax=Paraphaeosphaeria sporulosa TaxID=1460663 RepID=A0A177CG29_9PLEO|nr:uncharacterized protein CC84DRAFT_753988 [Paraphaeosphaeria sporulosa]OAG06181.1 hypothetical protein CC84DRAFT_753988 [Paraphaeosphaeria sporulosa]
MKPIRIITTFTQVIFVSASGGTKDPKPPHTPTYTPYTYTTSLCTPTATQPYTVTNTWYETSIAYTPHKSTWTWGSELYDCTTGLATTSILVS